MRLDDGSGRREGNVQRTNLGRLPQNKFSQGVFWLAILRLGHLGQRPEKLFNFFFVKNFFFPGFSFSGFAPRNGSLDMMPRDDATLSAIGPRRLGSIDKEQKKKIQRIRILHNARRMAG